MTWMDRDDDDDLIDKVSLSIRNNDDWVQPFVAQDYNPNTNQHGIHDLTGAQLRMQIRQLIFPAPPPASRQPPTLSPTVALDLQTENGFIVVASLPASGQFVIVVPAITVSSTLAVAGLYAGDMLVFGPDGSVKTLFTLELEVCQGDTVPTPT